MKKIFCLLVAVLLFSYCVVIDMRDMQMTLEQMERKEKIINHFSLSQEELPDTIPLLASFKTEIYQAKWDLNENRLKKVGEAICKENGGFTGYYSLQWDGETLLIDNEVEHFYTLYDTDKEVIRVVSNYKDLLEKNFVKDEMQFIFGAVASEDKVFWLQLDAQGELNILEYSNNSALKETKIADVAKSLITYLERKLERNSGYYGYYNEFIYQDGCYYIHDDVSVYQINVDKKDCQLLFSIPDDVPQEILEQYIAVKNSNIIHMGIYYGVLCLYLIPEVGSEYLYIPFAEEPYILDLDTDFLNADSVHNCIIPSKE